MLSLVLTLLHVLADAPRLCICGLIFLGPMISVAANNHPAHPPSDLVVEFDWSTHVERDADCIVNGDPGCIGDNWPTTWRDDGSVFSSWADGTGPGRRTGYSIGFASLGKPGPSPSIKEISTGYSKGPVAYNADCQRQTSLNDRLCGKTYALLDIDGIIWMWLSPGSGKTNFAYSRLHRSTDGGKSFQPVRNKQQNASREFIEFRAGDGLAMPAFAQHGRGYRNAQVHGNYVYIYTIRPFDTRRLSIQNSASGGMIDLARVPVDGLDDLSRYEWFAGGPGREVWTRNHAKRRAVFTDPTGVGWTVSVSRVPGIDRYVLMTEHGKSFQGRLGIYESDKPHGPWRRVAKYAFWPLDSGAQPSETASTATGLPGSRSFYWNIPTAWVEAESASFWMVFTGIGADDSFNLIRGRFVPGVR